MEVINHPNYLIYDDGRVFSKKNNKFLTHCISGFHNYKYVTLNEKKYLIHRLVATHYCNNNNPEKFNIVDHIDQDINNNYFKNLRWVDKSINGSNRPKQKNNTSGHKNIFYCNTYNKWFFRIKKNNKTISKSFNTIEDAIKYKEDYKNRFNLK